jgi:hypothetical protein
MAPAEAGIAPPESGRYTPDGDAAVEARIAADQALIARAVEALAEPPEFRALVLMGGYGRGEGGYVLRDGKPAPYNDYDYFVVVRGLDGARRRALQEALSQEGRALEHQVGVEVDFAVLREEGLPQAEYSLMNAEMIWGHRVVVGDQRVLATMPSMPFGSLPPGEFTRLLLNRGALLLMNRQRLAAAAPLGAKGREVFFKYLFKAVLACGDARLAGTGRYHPSYVHKRERLASMDWDGKGDFIDLYAPAWEAKFHPDYGRYAAADPAEWQERVVALWLATLSWYEQGRTGRAIPDWEAYCSAAISKGQGERSWWGVRNAVITLRDFGPAELARRPFWSLRYPRERLISALPLLLSDPLTGVRPAPAEALSVRPGTPWPKATETFLHLWRRYA